ncbi:MAG: hypothetical protein R8F63_00190 [Acidimicrobiales bacterium]|nr:hypothetical protein [Acidimicrobiales bacterium]
MGLDRHTTVDAAVEEAWSGLARAGAWWTGAQRVAIAAATRAAAPRPLWEKAPDLAALSREAAGAALSPFVAGLVERIAVEPSSLTRDDVRVITAELGDAAYAELASVVCQVVAVDQLAAALGADVRPLPEPVAGDPSRLRPEGMADVGGHIDMTADAVGPNVARSLSLAGDDHIRWRNLVFAMYSGDRFADMVWTTGALSRPQVELLAARTSALNECFY